jgi:hypothetical protein
MLSLTIFCAASLIILIVLQIWGGNNFAAEADPCSGSVENITPGEPPPVCAPAPTLFSGFQDWTDAQYFYGAYLPTLLAVIYSSFWDMAFMKLRELEPFFRLSKSRGAPASDSLLLRYGTASLPVALYLSIKNRDGQIIMASLVSLILTVTVPFASEVLYIGTKGTCPGDDCQPYLASRLVLAKLEEGLIGAVLCLVFVLAIF